MNRFRRFERSARWAAALFIILALLGLLLIAAINGRSL